MLENNGKATIKHLEKWLRLYLTMVMSIAGALVSAFAVPLNPRDPTTAARLQRLV